VARPSHSQAKGNQPPPGWGSSQSTSASLIRHLSQPKPLLGSCQYGSHQGGCPSARILLQHSPLLGTTRRHSHTTQEERTSITQHLSQPKPLLVPQLCQGPFVTQPTTKHHPTAIFADKVKLLVSRVFFPGSVRNNAHYCTPPNSTFHSPSHY
jgi:hypothetical protein